MYEIVHYIFVKDANFPNLYEGAVSPRHVEGAVFTEGVPNRVPMFLRKITWGYLIFRGAFFL